MQNDKKNYTVLWTPLARESYQQILDFAFEQWSIDLVIKLDDEVQKLLVYLKQNGFLCPPMDGQPNLHKCVITQYTSVVYRVKEETVELLTFYDTRTDHPF